MTPWFTRAVSIALAIAGVTTIASTQAPAPAPSTGVPGDWPTTAANAQRDGWLRGDAYISQEALAKGGFGLRWRLALPPSSRPSASITSWVSMSGRKPIAFVTDNAGVVLSIDTDTGLDYWRRVFDAPSGNRSDCLDALSSGAVRPMALIPATTGASRGGGFGPAVRPPFHGVIGEPGEGIAAELMGPASPSSVSPPASAPLGRATAAGGRGNDAPSGRSTTAPVPRGGRGGPQGLYVVAPDGVLHILGENSGLDVQKPVPFVPSGARPTGLSVVDGVAYVLTSGECGDGPSGARAVALAGDTRTVASWESNGAPTGLPAFGADGTVYVSVGPGKRNTGGPSNAVVALEPGTLRVKGWFASGSDIIATGPMVVRHKDRDLIVVAMRSGRVSVLDSAALSGNDHGTALSHADPETSGAPTGLAGHVDRDGNVCVLVSIDGAPAGGAIVAFSMDDAGVFKRVWTSSGLVSPLAPVIVNGVVFAASNTGDRIGGSAAAVLQALDPATGRNLWNSRGAMDGSVAGTLLVGNSQVYVATDKRIIYAFGFAMDR